MRRYWGPHTNYLVSMQDQMEKGSLTITDDSKCETSNGGLAAALRMMKVDHAHVLHEADPDTKVKCRIGMAPQESGFMPIASTHVNHVPVLCCS